MNDFSAFAKMVPGFDFLQGLTQNASAALPGIGQWVAPTLDPAEIEKRIGELRTVQFWLEQNVRMVDATVRALEVQRMTLSTLKTMNVRMEDLRSALTIPPPAPVAAPAPAPAPASAFAYAPTPAPASAPATAPAATGATPLAGIDPLQWWGALTQQFTDIATHAMKDSAAEATRRMGSVGVPRPGDDADAAASRAAVSRKTPAPKPGGRSNG